MPPDTQSPPPWVAETTAPPDYRFHLEDLLADGRDPLPVLLAAADSLPPASRMEVDAPVAPTPLARLLQDRGLDTWSSQDAGGRWHLHIRSAPPTHPQGPTKGASGHSHGGFWLKDGQMHLDVRSLPPPLPMREILRVIDTGLAGTELVIHVPHVPVPLFSALRERGWAWQVLNDGTKSGTEDDTKGTRLLLTLDDTA